MKIKVSKALFLRPEVILFLILSTYCSNPSEKNKENKDVEVAGKPKIHNTVIKSPKKDEVYKVADKIPIKLSLKNNKIVPDSILLFNGVEKIASLEKSIYEVEWNTSESKVGRTLLKSVSYYGDSITETNTVAVTLLSDVIPKSVKFEVVATYPHDEEAFTQGLVYHNGFFFEGTGQYKQSSLRKVNVETGKVINILDIGDEYFGEGIAIFDDKIFQLTWKSQVGFIYDKESFTLLQKIYYDTKEGWGLAYDGEQFILSDGTAKLYQIEPEYFTETGQVEVYDDKGMVTNLNELEYIQGLVFANIWGDKKIAIIEPSTGKVRAYLDMTPVIPDELKSRGDKVLNGIAFNPENNHIFVTGKNWPILFEIKLTEGFDKI